MSLFNKIELLEEQRKIRLTYSENDNTTHILIVGIDELFEELERENERNNESLLFKILINNRMLFH